MFGIGSWEFLVIVVLALLLFGPDKLPDFARTIGRFMRDFRRYQSMMESTIKMEVFAADPKLQKDPFKTGKDFAEKVGSGGFTRPTGAKQEAAQADAAQTDAAQTDAARTDEAAPSGATPPATSSGERTPDADSAAPDTSESGEEAPEQA